MEPLFEAKAPIEDKHAVYNIYRISRKKFSAKLVVDENEEPIAAPAELVIYKSDGKWNTEDDQFNELGEILGVEIDAFNNGYGALLGKIGID